MSAAIKILSFLVGFLVVCGLIILAVWTVVLNSQDPLDHALVDAMPWPVACSVRGCITTSAWKSHMQARVAFARSFSQDLPEANEALTTLIRQHLVEHAAVKSTVTLTDARRYRQELLKLEDQQQLKDITTLSLEEYDKLVILPLLEQEALIQQGGYESYDELFSELASKRPVFIPLWQWKWDSSSASVVPE